MPDFKYTEILPLGEDQTTYRKISDSGFKLEKIGKERGINVIDGIVNNINSLI